MTSFFELTDKLKKFNQYNKILAVLDSNDYSLISTTVYEALRAISNSLPRIRNPHPKNEKTSNIYRGMGNDEYAQENYKDAMHLYNLAALHAPEGSKALAYAFSNRSALYFKMRKFSSALIDIDLCLNIGADTGKLKDKLAKRQEDCYNSLWMESVEHNNVLQEFNDSKMADEFYQVTGKRNPKFPFAKSCLDIIMKDGKETVVTTADLKVGEVVSVEPAFVSLGMAVNKWIFCHYCSKYADNLIPCDTCNIALFCNQACKDKCWMEFHDIECNMIEICQLLPFWYVSWFRFVVKTWRAVQEDMKKFADVSKKALFFLSSSMQPLNVPRILFSHVEALAALPFTSRVPHDCDPKLFAAGVGRRVALIVMKPVRAGEELSFSYCGDYHMDPYEHRQFATYNFFGFFCRCEACLNNWKGTECECTEPTKAIVSKLQWADTIKEKYKVICETMNNMVPRHDDPTYTLVYTIFRQIMNTYQCAANNRQRISGNAGKVELNDEEMSMLDFARQFGVRF